MAVDREILDGQVWASDLVGTPADLDKPSDAIIAAGWAPQGAKPVRQYHNWLINALASSVAFFENQGFFEWDASISYEPNAIVIASNGAHYVGKAAANLGNDPTADDGTNWELFVDFLIPANYDILRPQFVSTATAQIDLVGPGSYPIAGIGRVGFTGVLSYNWTSLVNGVYSYLYIDKSTLSSPGSITAANLTDSIVSPTYDAVKGGYYNGDDRCIFSVRGTGAASYVRFVNRKDRVYITNNNEHSFVNVPTTGTYITYGAPAFVNELMVDFQAEAVAGITVLQAGPASGYASMRYNVSIVGQEETTAVTIACDTSQGLYLVSANNATTLDTGLNGWVLPKGM